MKAELDLGAPTAIELNKEVGENSNRVLKLLEELLLEYTKFPRAKYKPQLKKKKKLKKMASIEDWNSGLEDLVEKNGTKKQNYKDMKEKTRDFFG